MSELLSCPFCGGEAIIAEAATESGEYHSFSIICKHCVTGIFRPMFEGGEWNPYQTEAEAIEAWNTRQPPRAFDSVETTQRVAELEAELADAKAEIRRLEAQGEYMCRQIAKAKEALR